MRRAQRKKMAVEDQKKPARVIQNQYMLHLRGLDRLLSNLNTQYRYKQMPRG